MNSSRTDFTWSTKATDSLPTGGCPFHNIDWQNLCFALSAILALASYLWMRRWGRRNVPGPKGWLVVGSVPMLLKNWKRFHDFVMEFFENGHICILISLAFGFRSIFIAEPSLVEHVLKTKFFNYPKGRTITKHMEELMGKGIFNSDHKQWKMQRKVASFEFSSAVLHDFNTAVFKEHGVKLLRIISEYAESSRSMDLQQATRNFMDKIGEGGFGPVYFGKLPGSGMEVAVKVQAKNSNQGAREFATEVEILSQAKHPNLVLLIGYCEEKVGYMLVYEFLPGGTLEDRLYGSRSHPPLDWRTRLKIVVQAAKGIGHTFRVPISFGFGFFFTSAPK